MSHYSDPSNRRIALSRVGLAIALVMSPYPALTAGEKAELPDVKVGDRWKTEQKDKRTGATEAEVERTVTAVANGVIEGTENSGTFRVTTELNPIESTVNVITGNPRFLSFPLEVGKKWSMKYSFANKSNSGKGRVEGNVEVTGYEPVTVKAGTFDAFRLEAKNFWNNDANRSSGRSKTVLWYAPTARAVVRTEYEDGYNNWVRELVEVQLKP
ncbi:hypothetical protein [Piscinibacter defluvii]|uniref:hypothetical protein n=1 Tax=Piscinibacter defluvii TaxID=1796922 RepID=UPI000FDD118C|nr:hypothetical protein [Piscinibacter defluvii]